LKLWKEVAICNGIAIPSYALVMLVFTIGSAKASPYWASRLIIFNILIGSKVLTNTSTGGITDTDHSGRTDNQNGEDGRKTIYLISTSFSHSTEYYRRNTTNVKP
jgi:hypothetical protein